MSPITLQYRGRLLASNDKENKHEIRKYFHPQLKSLWEIHHQTFTTVL